MKKIIILSLLIILILLFSFNFVSAQETIKIESVPNWLQYIIDPVKRGVEKIPESTEGLFKKIQKKTEQKQEQVKQEIKKEVKKEAKGWVEEKIEWVEDFLSPLKIKIQQGSAWIRKGVDKVRNFLFNP
ncbi:hypothetical protein KKE74_00830 [Patescibacteria group bacterium]|nr:hypothetical protein [Patescibacteria group bacterium]